MIARRGQGTLQTPEDPVPAVRHLRELAVHDPRRANDPAAERLSDRLMAEANAEDRNLTGEALDERHADPGLRGRARPGGDDDPLRLPGCDLLQRERIVAIHLYVRAQPSRVLHDVVGEAVVVLD